MAAAKSPYSIGGKKGVQPQPNVNVGNQNDGSAKTKSQGNKGTGKARGALTRNPYPRGLA